MIVSFDLESIRGYAHSPAGRERALIADEHGFTFEEVDRWPRSRVDYYLARRAGLNKWQHDQAEARREEEREKAESNAPAGGGSSLPSGTPTGRGRQHAPTSPPEGYTEEEWGYVPNSMKSDVKAGLVDIPKERLKQMADADPDDYNA